MNKEKRAISERNRCKIRKQLVDDYKQSHGCCICGERDPVCLDLHHTDYWEKKDHGKRSSISQKLRKLSIEKLMIEVGQCSVVCSNCHRKLHASSGWEWVSGESSQDVPL